MSAQQEAEQIALGLGVAIMVYDRVLVVEAPPGREWHDGRCRILVARQDEDSLWTALLQHLKLGLRPERTSGSPR